MPSSTKAGTKPLRFSPTRFLLTLERFLAFLCIKAVWEIEEKLGYELATVLNSIFCYKLHPLELCSLATNGTQERAPDDEPPAVFVTHHRMQRYNNNLRKPKHSFVLTL